MTPTQLAVPPHSGEAAEQEPEVVYLVGHDGATERRLLEAWLANADVCGAGSRAIFYSRSR